MDDANKATKQDDTKTTNKGKPQEQAEYKYIGDDGGRWLFERRSDGLCITIDKPPKGSVHARTENLAVLLNARGKQWRPEVLKMVRQ